MKKETIIWILMLTLLASTVTATLGKELVTNGEFGGLDVPAMKDWNIKKGEWYSAYNPITGDQRLMLGSKKGIIYQDLNVEEYKQYEVTLDIYLLYKPIKIKLGDDVITVSERGVNTFIMKPNNNNKLQIIANSEIAEIPRTFQITSISVKEIV